MSRPGIPLALLSAVLFGAGTPFAKLLLGSVNPWMMAGLLYLGAGIGLAVVHFSRAVLQIPASEAPLRRSDLPWLGLVILAGGVGGPLLLMFGLARTDATSASLLLNLEGLATMGIAWVAFRENVDRLVLLGAFSILAGAALLSWHGGASLDFGAMLIAGACLCWGIDNNLTRKLSAADPVQIAMLKGLVAGTANVVLALVNGAAFPPPRLGSGRCDHRVSWLWRQPHSVCAGAAPSRYRPHGGLFFPRTFRRCCFGHAHPRRAADVKTLGRRRADGDWPLAASGGAA